MDNKDKEQKPRVPGIVSLPTSLTRRSRGRGVAPWPVFPEFRPPAPLSSGVGPYKPKPWSIELSNFERFLIGGVGGLAPVLMFLINVDFEKYFTDASTLKMIGYIFRAITLFLLGGFIAYLHDTERKKMTLFLIGLSAPSLVAGYITTAQQPPSQTESATPAKKNENHAGSLSFFSVAYADDNPMEESKPLKKFTLPQQSPSSQFLEGFVGIAPKNVWFVIVGSYLNLDNAKKQAISINTQFKKYHAEVYAPYGENPYYAVVIGDHLTQVEAKVFRDDAIKDGLPKDTYYKTFPNLPAWE